MEQLQNWAKVNAIKGSGDPISGLDRCTYFEKQLWLELENSMWSKHRSTFQDHVKYIHNDIVNPFIFGVLQYAEHIREMHDLSKCLPLLFMKGHQYGESDWDVRNKRISENEIRVATRDGLPT